MGTVSEPRECFPLNSDVIAYATFFYYFPVWDAMIAKSSLTKELYKPIEIAKMLGVTIAI